MMALLVMAVGEDYTKTIESNGTGDPQANSRDPVPAPA
jgi:hypothetical protein